MFLFLLEIKYPQQIVFPLLQFIFLLIFFTSVLYFNGMHFLYKLWFQDVLGHATIIHWKQMMGLRVGEREGGSFEFWVCVGFSLVWAGSSGQWVL